MLGFSLTRYGVSHGAFKVRRPTADTALGESEEKAIGIDLGLTHFAITSDGSKYDNPRHFKKHEHNLKPKPKKLSRKQKGSQSRAKARKLVARAF